MSRYGTGHGGCIELKPSSHSALRLLYVVTSPNTPIDMLAVAHFVKLRPFCSLTVRSLSTAATRELPSSIYLDSARAQDPAVTTTPQEVSPQLRHALESALRVDQAGELAANWIYKGQHDVFSRDPKLGPLIQARSITFHLSCRFDTLRRKCGIKRKSITPS